MSLWSNTDTQASKPKYLGLGQIQSITFTGTGTGYTNGASFTISAPPAGGVQATATAVVTAGAVTGFTITNPGAGYTSAPTVTLAGGSGQTFGSVIYGAAKVAAPNSSIVFVDLTEAQVPENRAKGVKIPGWTKITNTVDNAGNNRYRVENLVSMAITAASAGDAADDILVADVTGSPISVQPTNQTTVGGAATFSITATGTTPSYQWQVRAVGAAQYVNAVGTIAGITYANGTTASLGVTGATSALIANGTRIRCQVINAGGQSATSTPVTLTFGT